MSIGRVRTVTSEERRACGAGEPLKRAGVIIEVLERPGSASSWIALCGSALRSRQERRKR